MATLYITIQALQVLLACGHDIRAAWKSMQAESKPEGTFMSCRVVFV